MGALSNIWNSIFPLAPIPVEVSCRLPSAVADAAEKVFLWHCPPHTCLLTHHAPEAVQGAAVTVHKQFWQVLGRNNLA